jgi:hypothetical protein
MGQQTSTGNATPVEMTEAQQRLLDMITSVLSANEDHAAVIVLVLKKDGSVQRAGGTTVMNPPNLVAVVSDTLAHQAQLMFKSALAASEECNCPKCIAQRGGVFMAPNVKAEA